jgi:hypothetical protein
MLRNVLQRRVSIQFCILNESSATLGVGIFSYLLAIHQQDGRPGQTNFRQRLFFGQGALPDNCLNAGSAII